MKAVSVPEAGGERIIVSADKHRWEEWGKSYTMQNREALSDDSPSRHRCTCNDEEGSRTECFLRSSHSDVSVSVQFREVGENLERYFVALQGRYNAGHFRGYHSKRLVRLEFSHKLTAPYVPSNTVCYKLNVTHPTVLHDQDVAFNELSRSQTVHKWIRRKLYLLPFIVNRLKTFLIL